jgi:TonB family protein
MVVMTVTPQTAATAPSSNGSEYPTARILTWIWLAGVGLCLFRLAAARPPRWTTSVVSEQGEQIARELGIRRRVRFGESPDIPVAETYGLFRPVVVLPPSVACWTEDRLRVVLTHELIHVARHDWIVSVAAEAAASLHWFNPLAWVALRRLRLEREAACDDAVLARGVGACDYAEHLIGIVSGLRSPACASSVAMAQTSQLEHRIRSILDPQLKRGGLTMKSKWGVTAAATLLLATTVVFQAPAQSGTAGLSGTVLDPSSARVPFASVIVRSKTSKQTEITRTNDVGEFNLASLPAGDYTVEVARAGFQLSRQDVTLAPGSAQSMSVILATGRLNETITVSGQYTGANNRPSAADANVPPKRLRIGGNMQAAKMVKQVRPEYPAHLKAAGTEGTVLMEAVIGTDGRVMNLKTLNTQVHADFIKATTDAVNQWQYEPTYLNGVPVEILTQITVNFTLSR